MSDALLYFMKVPASPVAQVLGPSPAVLTNASPSLQVMVVAGGVVSLIEINAGAGYLPALSLFGSFPLMPTHSIRITYLVTPPTVQMVQF